MKKFFLYSGLMLLILVLVGISVSLFLVMTTGAKVARARAAVKAAGEPIDVAELAREPIPDEENAYFYLLQTENELEAFNDEYFELGEWDTRHKLRPDQVEALRRIVDNVSRNSKLYELLDRAAQCDKFDSRIDYSQGFAVELTHLELLRSAVRALDAKALVAAYGGRGDEALSYYEQSLRLTAGLHEEPILISHLVSIACQALVVLSTNHVLQTTDTTPEARERLDALLAKFDNQQAGGNAIRGERAMGVLAFEQLRRGELDTSMLGDENSRVRWLSGHWLGQAYLNDDEVKYLELMDCYIQAADLVGKERDALVDRVDNDLQQSGMRFLLTRLVVPSLGAALKANDRGDTYNRCLRVMLAVQGTDVPKLAELGLPTDVTYDPAGRPLVVRKTENVWLVYSVGENGIDDGGNLDDSNFPMLDIGIGPLLEPLPEESSDD